MMEQVQDLFVTAFVAVLFSFLFAKLVSVAVAGDAGREEEVKSMKIVDEEIVLGETKFEEKLSVRGFERGKIVKFADQGVKKADEFEGETVETEDRGKEIANDRCKVTEKSSELVGLPKNSSEENSGEEKVMIAEKQTNTHNLVEESFENKEIDAISEGLPTDNVIIAQREEITVVENEVEGRDQGKIDSVVSDGEDWEGIERSDLEKVFAEAANFVRSGDKGDQLGSGGSDVQMEFYGLHKVATEGPCREPQPMPLMLSARSKCDGRDWFRCARNAWQKLGNMSPDEAMEQYISLLSDKVPRWMEDNPAGETKAYFLEAGRSTTPDPNSISFSHHHPNFANERKPEVESSVEGSELTGGSNLANRAK